MVAGGGAAPVEIAASIIKRGGAVHVICIDGDADAALHAYPHTIVKWSELTRAISALKAANVADVLLVGTMARPKFWTAKFDLAFFSVIPAVLKVLRQGGDDALLRTCIALFEKRGFRAIGIRDAAPDLLMPPGAIGAHRPSAGDEADIALGLRLIAALGRFDIGQAAIVSEGLIEAIEGAEGTDAILKRVAAARRVAGRPSAARRGVLVKRPKPGQDLRVDLPAIGPATATAAAHAALAGIAAMQGHVVIADRDELVRRANAAEIFVYGVDAPLDADAAALEGEPEMMELGAVMLSSAARADALLGTRVLDALAEFGGGSGLVVRGRRVMAIGASEPAVEVFRRDATFNTRGVNSRRGAAVVGRGAPVDEALITAAAQAGAAAVVITAEQEAAIIDRQKILASANSLRLALVVASQRAPEAMR